jgi:hypothetical protein
MSKAVVATRQNERKESSSSLVRRLINAQNDPAKYRIREWLKKADDERLSEFGLTPSDIGLLRGKL